MQSTGNLGCFPRGKQAAIVRRYPVVVVVFSCVQCFLVSIIHRTLTWTTDCLTCVRSYAWVDTRGWGTPTTSQHNILTRKNSHKLFWYSGRDLNLCSWNPLDVEADAPPIEPPRPRRLTHIPVNSVKEAFPTWMDRLRKCVDAEGEYLEDVK